MIINYKDEGPWYLHTQTDDDMFLFKKEISKSVSQSDSQLLLLKKEEVIKYYAGLHDKETIKLLEKENIFIPIKHISNSAGIIDIPNANLDLVRCGIATYGLYPSKDVDQTHVELKPALSLKTHVSFVKEVQEGVGVSYGSSYITSKITKIATIPVGYGDGYPRNLSSKGRVLIRGKSVPIIGKICMDQFMVDVSNIDKVEQGDIVTLIGKDGDKYISVEELSDLSGTFNYEFICNLGKRIPRLYYSNNKIVEIKEYID